MKDRNQGFYTKNNPQATVKRLLITKYLFFMLHLDNMEIAKELTSIVLRKADMMLPRKRRMMEGLYHLSHGIFTRV